MKSNKKSSFLSNLTGIVLAVLLALGVRSLFLEPYNIPSSSMVPTLLVGDYLFISKYSYGYSRHSFPFSLPLVPKGRVFADEPERGDVAVFKVPTDNKTDYIKRVIGLPGDKVQLIGGRLYINDTLVPRTPQGSQTVRTEAGFQTYNRYEETLPGGIKHLIYELSDDKMTDDTDPVYVPQGHYFMLGDNRDNSADSRFWGSVPFENLEGKAEFLFYSNNGTGAAWEFWKWRQSLRLDRFFTRIR